MYLSNNEQKNFSKECLQLALFELMKTKSFDEITIIELCEKAGMSRNAYYRHYNNKQTIIIDFVATVTESFYKKIGNVKQLSRRDFLINLFNHLYNQREVIALIYKNNFSYILEDIFAEYTIHFTEKNKDVGYENYYFGGGLYMVAMKWIFKGCPETPGKMADLIISFQKNPNNYGFM